MMGMVKKSPFLSNTATLGTDYGYKVVQYMLKMIKPVSTEIHKKMKNDNFCLSNIASSHGSQAGMHRKNLPDGFIVAVNTFAQYVDDSLALIFFMGKWVRLFLDVCCGVIGVFIPLSYLQILYVHSDVVDDANIRK